MNHTTKRPSAVRRAAKRVTRSLLFAAGLIAAGTVPAQDTVCARVKIEIKQELALERQGFDAEMKINNTTDTDTIDNVGIEVKVTDENGTLVHISDDPNDLTAKFFIKVSNKENISAIDGTGTVAPKTTSVIGWTLIPAPGAAGNSPVGKKFLVGATLNYRFGGENTALDVSPAVITVKPLPLLTLDYFLPQHVEGDDPLTAEIEPVVPFTLGVRVKNNGFATAKNLKIDSAQPKIIENKQGALINFVLDGSYVNDAPTQNTLLINFGDVAANTSKMGRWVMETSLAGTFTEFTAKFSHADELGGAMTSILQATNAHVLVRDVRVDLPGRDAVRDFLAQDGDVMRVYESDGPDTEVTDRSGAAVIAPGTDASGNASYHLTFPATSGFAYVKLPDPFNGTKVLGQVVRSDGKQMLAENVWLSRTRNEQTKKWEYWINFFDVNTTGVYDSQFQDPVTGNRAPVFQFIPDHVVTEGKQVSFLVEASSPDGRPVVITAAPLPAGAHLIPQAGDPATPGLARTVFDWTPAVGSAGTYAVTYTANDGLYQTTRSASIRVEAVATPVGPAMPALASPLSGAQVAALKPVLVVQTPAEANDPTTQVQFEVYGDQALTQLVATGTVDKAAAGPTSWSLPNALNDNTRYWWRVRGYDGKSDSLWNYGQFFVNQFNNPPNNFQLLSPRSGAELSASRQMLTWASATDKEGDAVTYSVYVYTNSAASTVVTSATNLPSAPNGINTWQAGTGLKAGTTYYWRVVARDALGAETSTPAQPFLVGTNVPPAQASIMAPVDGATVTSNSVDLTVAASADSEGDAVQYEFELDSDPGFQSADKRSSGLVPGGGSTVKYTAANLREDTWYYWRVRAADSHGDAGWSAGRFFVNAHNDAPALPGARNPGNGAWVASLQPVFDVAPAVDPEGDAVRYVFQISSQAAEAGVIVGGSSATPNWVASQALADGATYWWRYRVADAAGATSAWSAWSTFTVGVRATEAVLAIQLVEPAVVQAPAVQGGRKVVTLRWEAAPLPGDANVSLYYVPEIGAASSVAIMEGISWPAGSKLGSYLWDVTDLAPGAYRVVANLHTGSAVAEASAPGRIVVPTTVQSGKLLLLSGTGSTDETGKTWTIQVKLGSAPIAPVTIPVSSSNVREGVVQVNSVTFTPQNWSTYQNVVVTGVNDCVRDGNQRYWIDFGKAVTIDPDYIGITAAPQLMLNLDNGSLTQGCPQQ
jgi:hypothetical protein